MQSPPVPSRRPQALRILSAEATGVLIIALLVLAITLVRFWHVMPWSAR